jgi:hypothetical protein
MKRVGVSIKEGSQLHSIKLEMRGCKLKSGEYLEEGITGNTGKTRHSIFNTSYDFLWAGIDQLV